MLVALSDAYFLEVSAKVALKVATKDYFRDKQAVKIKLFRLFFRRKKEELDQKNRSFSDKFGMLKTGSDTEFLKVSAHTESSHQQFL